MKLYEIDSEIMACLDEDTGEILDLERLQELQIEREKKLEGVALYIKNVSADIDAIKAEKKVLEERARVLENKVKSLKGYLANALNGAKMATPRVAISFRKSETVEIPEGFKVETLPEGLYKVETEYKADKTAIKEYLKGGNELEGVSLKVNNNIQIK